jgi:hypothetical protein
MLLYCSFFFVYEHLIYLRSLMNFVPVCVVSSVVRVTVSFFTYATRVACPACLYMSNRRLQPIGPFVWYVGGT